MNSHPLQGNTPAYTDLQYELVALLPEHLILPGMSVSVFHSAEDSSNTAILKNYVLADDRSLREAPGKENSPRFPPFSSPMRNDSGQRLNPFLVIINAEIKFRRFIRGNKLGELPQDVRELIQKTCQVVEQIYWQPDALVQYARSQPIESQMDIDEGESNSGSDYVSEIGVLSQGSKREYGGSTAKPAKRGRAVHSSIPTHGITKEYMDQLIGRSSYWFLCLFVFYRTPNHYDLRPASDE